MTPQAAPSFPVDPNPFPWAPGHLTHPPNPSQPPVLNTPLPHHPPTTPTPMPNPSSPQPPQIPPHDPLTVRPDSDSDSDSEHTDTTSHPKSKEMKRMIEFIVRLFPQAKGQENIFDPPRAVFEKIYNQEPPTPPSYSFAWFERVLLELQKSDSRLARFFSRNNKRYYSLFPKKHSSYLVPGNPSQGSYLPVNQTLLTFLYGSFSNSFCWHDRP